MAVGICGLAAVEDIDLSLLICGIHAHGFGRRFISKVSTSAEEKIEIVEVSQWLVRNIRRVSPEKD